MSTRLTKLQITHLTNRIKTLSDQLKHKELTKLGKRPEALEHSEKEKMALISSGKAKLDPNMRRRQYTDSPAIFFSYPETAAQIRRKKEVAAYDTKVDQLRARYAADEQRMIDEAVLGDSVAAMAMLQALQARLTSA